MLCLDQPADWWDTGDNGNRTALDMCRTCPTGCPNNDPYPHGVIRDGIPYGNNGRPRPLCPCGYPVETDHAKPGADSRCRRCQTPTIANHRTQIIDMRQTGATFLQIAETVPFSADHIRQKYRDWTSQEATAA